MAIRSAVHLGVFLLSGALAVTACGGSDGTGDGKVYTVTSPTSSAASAPTPTPTATPGTVKTLEGARAALRAFLRGQAAGDVSVCRYVGEGSAFLKGPALRGDCLKGVRYSPHSLRPMEREALATVSITGGSLKGAEATIPFASLKWERGHLAVESVQSEFLLRWQKGVWQIVR